MNKDSGMNAVKDLVERILELGFEKEKEFTVGTGGRLVGVFRSRVRRKTLELEIDVEGARLWVVKMGKRRQFGYEEFLGRMEQALEGSLEGQRRGLMRSEE